MTTAAKTFIVAIAAVAASAAIGVGMANRAAAPATDIVKLERVVVAGKRADAMTVATLPRVVIEGRRTASSDVTLAMSTTWAAMV